MELELYSELSLVSGERIVISVLHRNIRSWNKAFKAFLEKKLLYDNPLNFRVTFAVAAFFRDNVVVKCLPDFLSCTELHV